MLNDSILGKLYIYWQNSLIYALIAKIYHFFSNAFSFSVTKKVLCRASLLEKWYQNCLISKIIDWIIVFIMLIIKSISGFLKPAYENSFFVKYISGSFILRFDFLLGAWICVMYMVPHSYWSNGFAALAACGLLLIYAVLCANGKRTLVYPRELSLPFLIFVAITPITLLYTEAYSNSIRVLVFFFTAFMFMWIVASNTDSVFKLRQLLGFIYIVVIFTSVFAIGQRMAGLEVNPTFIDAELNPNIPARVFSTVDNPNNFAELLVLFTPLAAVYAMNERKAARRFICSCLLVIPAVALLMTYSRSGWLSIALTVLVFVYYTNKSLLPWIFVLALLAVPFLPASIMTRLGNLLNTSDKSASFRLTLWQTCIHLLGMGNRWLTGIGLGPRTYNYNMLLVAEQRVAEGMPHTQMLYMDLFMQWGVFGFISFMWFAVTKIVNAANSIAKAQDPIVKGTLIAAVSSFLGIAILSIFEYIWFYPRILFAYFILMGIMIGCIRMVKRSSK